MDSPVIIAGGGPVGMTLALELAHHNVRSIVLEQNETTTRHPKMDLTNGRSMELFRRLGIVPALRAVGVPEDHPLDVVWGTRLNGHVLKRFAYPSPKVMSIRAIAANDGRSTSEPPMRVSQIVLEPVLKAALDANSLIDVRFGSAFEDLTQDAGGVTVTVRKSATGEVEKLRCGYLAGCDGGGSKVRRKLNIELEGEHAIGRAYMVHFKSSADILHRHGLIYHFQTGLGTVISQDGGETYTLQMMLPPGVDEKALDPADLLRQFAGEDFQFEILVSNPWSPHMVIAEEYGRGRVFLAGDAVHQVVPTGGYGMNTGIADAVDLGWKLAAAVNGWAGPQLLGSYKIERHQIAVQNRAAALRHLMVRVAIGEKINEAEQACDLDSEEAAEKRQALGRDIAALGNAENESWGIEHGYRYTGSPVIAVADEDGTEPAFDPLHSAPTTWPGSRLPAVFLEDGSVLADQLGRDFSLLVADDLDVSELVKGAAEAGVPLTLVKVPELARSILQKKLVLVRPDQHVAWRGDDVPAHARALFDQVAGYANAELGIPA